MAAALPLLPAQRRLWFSIALEGASPGHNLAVVLHLDGPLHVDALRAALHDVVERHEGLRAAFAQDDTGAPVQRIVSRPPVESIVEHRTVAESQLPAMVAACAGHAFDLGTELPVHAWLFAVRPDRHVLALVLHRLVADETSLPVIGRDLATAYRARLAGQPPHWPTPVSRYIDHVRRQHEEYGDAAAGEGRLDARLEYWTGRLANLPDRLEFLSSTPTPPEAGASVTVPFTASVRPHARLRALAVEHQTSVDIVVLAAITAVLSRSSGATDILVGRSINEGAADLVGPVGNTLVLRIDTSDDPTIGQLVARVRDADHEARAAGLPLDLVVEALDPPPARSRFLPAALASRPDPGACFALDGVAVTAVGTPTGFVRSDLTFTLDDRTGHDHNPLQGTLTYPAALPGLAGARDLADRLARVLVAFVPGSRQRLSEIEVLSADEGARLVYGFNATARDGCDHTMPALVESQVLRTPDDFAVVSDEATLTYSELNTRANQLAHHLIGLGIGPEDIVALALPRCVEATVAALGVVKAGAAYLPVDLTSPADRLGYIMADAAPRLVVVRGSAGERQLPTGLARLDLADPATGRLLDAQPGDNPTDFDRRQPLRLEHPAYVIYTSGSTGRPKGVVVAHIGIESVIFSVIRGLRIKRGSRVVQLASPSFDVVVWDTCCALFCGAALVVVSERQSTLGPPFVDLVDRHGATHVTLSPTALDALPERDPRLRSLAVTVVGENCGEHVFQTWSAGRQFVNGYGPTEVTICATLSEPLTGSGKPTIGGPIDNVHVFVLNAALSPVPVGVAGELYVGGVGLARGYLGRPDLTAERFLPNPFGAPGSRMYRTGDLVRWRADGLMDFVGRVDSQIKIRGYRVELGEIESVLAGCAGVAQVAVVVAGEELWNRRLVAYVVADNGGAVDEETLQARARTMLPDYMNPSAYIGVAALPVTTSGKLDRRALETSLRHHADSPAMKEATGI